MMRKIIIAFLFTFLIISKSLHGYDDEKTHRQLTERAIDKSSLSVYLKNNLGFKEGTSSLINNKAITWWLSEGAYLEDSPMCRASNHFHNPLKPWDQSYMTDVNTVLGLVPQIWCYLTDWPQSERKSLVTWGTGYLSPAPNGTKIAISKQEWGWDNARSYYYLALTSAVNTDREKYFANTFQALGQVLHLIEDGAQPAHVRDDFESHLKFIGFESIDPRRWFGSKYEHYIKTHADLVTNAIPSALPSFTRLTDFWDTDQYTGQDPSILDSYSLGVTEFTNANYFSDETIPNNNPTPEHTFPYPQISSTKYQICEELISPNSTEKISYISRKDKGPCPPPEEMKADHFAAVSLLNEEPLLINENISTLMLELDNNVHNTYAQDLLPRAVGYSAGLLNYFFRGNFRIYNVSYDSTSITMWIMNKTYVDPSDSLNSAIEPMGPGTLVVSYSYKDSLGNTVYGVTGTVNVDTVPNARDNMYIEATFPLNPSIPTDAQDVSFILIFRGVLGNENDAIAAKATGDSFREEWNNGLKGNHTWLYTDTDIINNSPNVGETANTLQNERLIKENVRYAWKKSYSHINETYIGETAINPAGGDNTYCTNSLYTYCFPYDFGKDFPLPVTQDTSLSVKIDAMNINQAMPSCSWIYGAYQGIRFTFRFEDGSTDSFFITSTGNEFSGKNVYIPLGQDISMNIYGILEYFYGRSITGTVELIDINVVQKILSDCGYPEVEYRQHMEVDHIRVW